MTTLVASPARAAAAKAGLPISIEESGKDGATLATAMRLHDAGQLFADRSSIVVIEVIRQAHPDALGGAS